MQGFAQPGTLDPTFADNAVFKLINFLEGTEEKMFHTLVDNQDFIWMAGEIEQNNEDKIVIIRLTPDGNYESTFGDNGKMILDMHSGSWERVTGLALQGDDLLVAGHAVINGDPKQFVLKLQSNGLLDADFGDSSVANLPYDVTTTGIVVDESGHIYLSGTALDNVTITKLLPDGTLDASFNEFGVQMSEFDSEDESTGITLDSDGNIYVFGMSDINGPSATITSVKPDGSLNTNFSDSGRRTFAWPDDQFFIMNSAILNSDETIFYLAGFIYDNFDMQSAIMAVDFSSGMIESFGDGGYVLFNPSVGSEDGINQILEGPEGLYASLTTTTPDEFTSGVALFTTNGGLATDFGVDGVAHINVLILGDDIAREISFQSDGALVVGGIANSNESGDFGYAARINTSGIFTGIESTSAASFSVFPNPATDYLHIDEGAQVMSGKEFRIVDIHGRVVLDNTIQSDQPAIPIHILTPGIYHLVIENMKPVRFIKTR